MSMMPAAGPRLGPYETWVYGQGRPYDLPALMLDQARVLSAITEVAGGMPSTAVPGGQLGSGAAPRYMVPTLFRRPGLSLSVLPFLMRPAAGTPLPELDLSDIAHQVHHFRSFLPGVPGPHCHDRVNFPLRGQSVDTAFPAAPAATPPDPGAPAPKVIVAVIDEGIPFAHRNFRNLAGAPRIDHCWSQSAPADQTGQVAFGRELTRAGIAALIAAHGTDEAAIYRAAGLLTAPGRPPMPLDRAAAHGAHVLDTLAGCWDAATEDEVRIIAVDLPATVSWDTSGFGKDMFVLSALHYIFDRADRIAAAHGTGPLPLVVNLSYGHTGGPHDPSALLAAAFDELVAARRAEAPTALVIPSGNTFTDRLHAVLDPSDFSPGPSPRATLRWRLPPDDRTSTYLESWLPAGAAPGDITLDLLAPDQSLAASLTGGPGAACDIAVAGRIVGRLAFENYRGQRWRAVVALAPTTPCRAGLPACPAGDWSVRVTLASAAALPTATDIRFWAQRDVSYGQGHTGARQSQLVDPAAPPYGPDGAPVQTDPADPAAHLRRFGSLNGLATGLTTLVAGGYRARSRTAAPYSSAGGSPDGASPGSPVIAAEAVDVAAPVERLRWHPGVTAAGSHGGITRAQQGTSSAAPQVARHLAEVFRQQGASLTPAAGADNYASLLAPLALPVLPPLGDGPDGRQRLGAWLLPAPARRSPSAAIAWRPDPP